MNNYNTYTNDNISRQGLINSFNQSQQIKPNELINDNPSINRDGFERENKLMKSLNDDILQLNTQLKSLLMKQNDYDKISNENNSEFKFLILENLPKEKIDKYKKFLIKNNIALINCPMPQGEKYVVKGEGHPSALGHKITSVCIYKEIEILNIN